MLSLSLQLSLIAHDFVSEMIAVTAVHRMAEPALLISIDEPPLVVARLGWSIEFHWEVSQLRNVLRGTLSQSSVLAVLLQDCHRLLQRLVVVRGGATLRLVGACLAIALGWRDQLPLAILSRLRLIRLPSVLWRRTPPGLPCRLPLGRPRSRRRRLLPLRILPAFPLLIWTCRRRLAYDIYLLKLDLIV